MHGSLKARDLNIYHETVKKNKINTEDKLQAYVEKFIEKAKVENCSYSLLEDNTSIETHSGENIEFSNQEAENLIKPCKKDEISFIYYYIYDEAYWDIELESLDKVELITSKFEEFQLIISFIQDDEQLEFEQNAATDNNGVFISILTSDKKSIVLNLNTNNIIDELCKNILE